MLRLTKLMALSLVLFSSARAVAEDFPFLCQTQQESEIAGFRLEPCPGCAKPYRVVLFTRVGISTKLQVDLSLSQDQRYYVGVGSGLGALPGTAKHIYVAINRAQPAASLVDYQVRPLGVPPELGAHVGPAQCQIPGKE